MYHSIKHLCSIAKISVASKKCSLVSSVFFYKSVELFKILTQLWAWTDFIKRLSRVQTTLTILYTNYHKSLQKQVDEIVVQNLDGMNFSWLHVLRVLLKLNNTIKTYGINADSIVVFRALCFRCSCFIFQNRVWFI